MTPERHVLAVASGGGHWVQLLRLAPAFEGHVVTYATVDAGYRREVGDAPFFVLSDATRWDRSALLRLCVQVFRLLRRVKPDVVVSTGAAPGFFAVALGKLTGARTVWIDSIANVERLSLSGMLARPFSDLWLTQWEHLARERGPRHVGSLL